jgi:hypothetical protein
VVIDGTPGRLKRLPTRQAYRGDPSRSLSQF